MSTPWTMTRVVRWRVRDWASCFLDCRFPIDKGLDRYFTSTPPPKPTTTVVYDGTSITSRDKEGRKKMPRQRKCESERQRKRSSLQAEDVVVVTVEKKTIDDSSWPQIEDEDYIVFCFKEGGAFDVIKKDNSETSSKCIDLASTSSRPVTRKLNYGEDDKATRRYSNETKINGGTHDIYPTNDGDHTISPQKDEEEEDMENVYMDKELAKGENRRTNHNEVIDDHRIMAVPTESSDSNHSDVSNGSFAFPVLGWEWSGSPAQMPKSESLQLRKHKARCVRFQCCKF